jgi:serpin B
MKPRLWLLFACALIGFFSTGCNRDSSSDEIEIFDETLRTDAATSHVAEANNAFAFELFKAIGGQENACLSPFSVSSALSMSMAGARNNTLQEMAKVLHVGDLDPDQWHSSQGRIITALNDADVNGNLQLRVANRIWLHFGRTLQPAFGDKLENLYRSSTATVDFRKQQAAADQVNRWVAEATNHRITKSMSPDDVSSDTWLVLTNAVYFKADWKVKFDESQTEDGQFKTFDGTVTVPFMQHEKAKFRNGRMDGIHCLELPYQGGALSMIVLLPETEQPQESPSAGLARLETQIGDRFEKWYENIYATDLSVRLPRFKFTTTARLKPALESMGMRSAFAPDADFSGMMAAPADAEQTPPLWLDDVLHSTFLEVNEEGTEAAAATHNPYVKSAIGRPFAADRPFLFVIREYSTGLILFLGRVADPSEE